MKLTDALRNEIDSMSYEELLRKWRVYEIGDPLFEGDSGDYYSQRMRTMRKTTITVDDHVDISKKLGLDLPKNIQ